jgi:hypothetical protein
VPVTRATVAAKPFYRSRFLITGVTLLALGAGNVVIGSQKLSQYQRSVAEGRERGYFPDAGNADGILRPVDDESERYNIARAKVDLYHVVLSGGLLMLTLGVILTVAAWVRLRIRRDRVPSTAAPSGGVAP